MNPMLTLVGCVDVLLKLRFPSSLIIAHWARKGRGLISTIILQMFDQIILSSVSSFAVCAFETFERIVSKRGRTHFTYLENGNLKHEFKHTNMSAII